MSLDGTSACFSLSGAPHLPTLPTLVQEAACPLSPALRAGPGSPWDGFPTPISSWAPQPGQPMLTGCVRALGTESRVHAAW